MKHAPAGYEPLEADEALGSLTFVGATRTDYIMVKPDRHWRLVHWKKRIPERFRHEARLRSNLIVRIPE